MDEQVLEANRPGSPDAEPEPEPVDAIPEPRPGEPADRPGCRDGVAGLGRRVDRLERLLWATSTEVDGEPEPDPELVGLAKSAEYAQTLSTMLLTPKVRAACEQAIESWQHWRREHDRVRYDAVEASRVIAITAGGKDRHTEAVRAFESARAELAALRACERQARNAASHATAQLAHDEEVRERYQPEINAGHRAWAILMARLRAGIGGAVERAEPLPGWLVTSLGSPPVGDPDRWIDLAAQLLAFRITYAIGDPSRPLGDEPTATHSSRCRQWHRELRGQLERWQYEG